MTLEISTVYLYALAAYLSIGFSKFVLCAVHVPYIHSCFMRKDGIPLYSLYSIGMVSLYTVVLIFMCLFAWPKALAREGLSFFRSPTTEEIDEEIGAK